MGGGLENDDERREQTCKTLTITAMAVGFENGW